MKESFEKVLHQYTPMIHHIIKSLNIYKNTDLYFHEATIALWEATLSFQSGKGKFSSYAYSSIRGKLLNSLKKEIKWETHHSSLEEPFEPIHLQEIPLMDNLDEYTQNLTENQKKWLVDFIINGKKIEEIAEQEKVTISAVKSWRRGALKKLKLQLTLH